MDIIKMTEELQSAITGIEYAVKNHDGGQYPDMLVLAQYRSMCGSLLDALEGGEGVDG